MKLLLSFMLLTLFSCAHHHESSDHHHHQGIRVNFYQQNSHQYPNLKIASYSHAGKIAESLEFLNRPALGVQYHPEKALTVNNGRPIWKWFLNKACEKSNLRQ